MPTPFRAMGPILVVAAFLPLACSSSESGSGARPDAGANADVHQDATSDALGDGATEGSHPDGCIAKTCLQLGASCGDVDDGCGGMLECGTCTPPLTCGGSGEPYQCGCTARSCAQLGVNCGDFDTGCGAVACGECTAPETCGGSGVDSQCGCVCSLPHGVTSCSAGACYLDACEDGWANCDGDMTNGCETHTNESLSNCGACGETCSFPHAADVKCSDGTCAMGGCEPGFDDCDGNQDNGCEANLAGNPSHCGACDKQCPANGGTPACVFGTCTVSNCSPGLGDCTTAPGCETNLTSSTSHCGFCGNACGFAQGIPTCVQGMCRLDACNDGYGDCDQNEANGCETNTLSSATHCGACNSICKSAVNATTTCVGGNCFYTCVSPWVDCDGAAGCEVNATADPLNCGGCNLACSTSHVYDVSCGKGGVCFGDCEPGWGDCNNDLRTDGCETSLMNDPLQCGGCGMACSMNHVANSLCKNGICGGSCQTGWGNCDYDMRTNGCETNVLTNKEHCGACGQACGDCQGCSNGICVGMPCE